MTSVSFLNKLFSPSVVKKQHKIVFFEAGRNYSRIAIKTAKTSLCLKCLNPHYLLNFYRSAGFNSYAGLQRTEKAKYSAAMSQRCDQIP